MRTDSMDNWSLGGHRYWLLNSLRMTLGVDVLLFGTNTVTTAADRDSRRLNQALWLVLRRYGRQITRRPWISVPALIMPGIGDVLIFYAPPLVVAQLLGAVARGEALTIGTFMPYVPAFTALGSRAKSCGEEPRRSSHGSEIRGIESLYVEAMDELLAKDLAFFHNNFAGSLTKRALGYARRFEDVFDVLAFSGGRERSRRWRLSPWCCGATRRC